MHTLLEDGQPTRFANEHIRPLDDDNGSKEHCMTGELDDLALGVSPLLAIGIDQIQHILVIPWHAKALDILGQESVLHQDNKVANESA